MARVRIWDVPTRLFHWLLAALFGFSWWTAENDQLDWHMWSGFAILTLVLFRLYWGFVGSTTSRFSAFLRGPRAVLAYARQLFNRSDDAVPGHNPMGGWSVAALLLLLLVQTGLGLFAVDVDGLESGPLDYLVSFDTGRALSGWHETVFKLLEVLIVLHVLAVAFHQLYKRENLLGAMVVGWRRMPAAGRDRVLFVPIWWALPGLGAAALIVCVVVFVRF